MCHLHHRLRVQREGLCICGNSWLVIPGKRVLRHDWPVDLQGINAHVSGQYCEALSLVVLCCRLEALSTLSAAYRAPAHRMWRQPGRALGMSPSPHTLVTTAAHACTLRGVGSVTQCLCVMGISEAHDKGHGLVAVNWECKLASWTEQCSNFPNICTYPVEDAGPTVT